MSDLRPALRQLRRSPAHVAAVILSLGIGMALCVATFSAVNAVAFRVVPGVKDRPTLIHVRSEGFSRLRPDQLDAAAGQLASSFASIGAERERAMPVALPSGPATLNAAFVSARFFETLGTQPVSGRLLGPDDAVSSAPAVAVISERLWRQSLREDPGIIGRTLDVGGRPFAIVGVTPAGLSGLLVQDRGEAAYPQVWLPLTHAAAWSGSATSGLFVAGRLRAGVSLKSARAEAGLLAARLASAEPTRHPHVRVTVYRAGFDWNDASWDAAGAVGLFLFIPAGVLLIGCANVVNLQLARASERAGELSVRLAMGASRVRLVRLLGIEVVLLASVAGVIGWQGARLMLASAQPLFAAPLVVDRHVLFFALALVTGVVGLAGLAPAWLATQDAVTAGLKEPTGGGVRHRRLRCGLVALQVAASVALLFISALGIRTLVARSPAPLPESRETVIAEFRLSDLGYSNERAAHFADAVLQRLRDGKSVRAAGFADFLRVDGSVRYWRTGDAEDARRRAFGGFVTSGWFEAMNVRLVAGRGFAGNSSAPTEAVVSESLAELLGAPGAAVLGRTLSIAHPVDAPAHPVEIVGVVADHVRSSADRPEPLIYLPMPRAAPASLVLFARGQDPEAVAALIRTAVSAADPAVPWVRLATLEARQREAFRGFREMAWLGTALGTLALFLAAAGLYAVLSYTVRRRTHEIGVRMALGARRVEVVRLVLRDGLGFVCVGAVLGLAVAVPIAFAMRSMFAGLSPLDPLAMLPTLGSLCLVSLLASALPAARAAGVDPATALRDE